MKIKLLDSINCFKGERGEIFYRDVPLYMYKGDRGDRGTSGRAVMK